MKKQPANNLLITIILVALLFVWIFITVALTDGREISDFTQTDKVIFACFGVVELLTVIFVFVFAARTGKDNIKFNINDPKPALMPKEQKVINFRGNIILILSLIFGFGSVLAGLTLRDRIPSVLAYWVVASVITLTVIVLILNIILKRAAIKKLNHRNVEEAQAFLLSHREHAEETSRDKAALIRKIRIATEWYAVIMALLGLVIGIFSGAAMDADDSPVIYSFISALLWLCGLSRIRFAPPKVIFEEYTSYIKEKDFPLLYQTVRKAAKKLECREDIRICLIPDCNASITRIGNIISVSIGVILISVCSREEIYTLMLHEFAHIKESSFSSTKEERYSQWLGEGGTPNFLSGITSLLFSYPDTLFSIQYELYHYAHTLIAEAQADCTMTEHGDVECAASALLKINYHSLYLWELDGKDLENIYTSPEQGKYVVANNIKRFKSSIEQRRDDWRKLTDAEILSRSATHPTIKMRLSAMGAAHADIIDTRDSEDFAKEKEAAVEYVDGILYDSLSSTYDDTRESCYLKPKKVVDDWMAEGKPVTVEDYQRIVVALQDLGMRSMAEKVCDKAIDVFEGAATAFAHYVKGMLMLSRYDDEGIEHIYYAMEKNNNGITGGLDIIGHYCCLTGNEEQLGIYRQRLVELAQEVIDKYSEANVLTRRDKLSEEQLPEGMLDYILNYISSIDDEDINKIYLVRKTVTEDYSISVFVIDYANSNPEEQDELQYKIYCCLDAIDHHFSLFNYLDVASVGVEKINNSCVYSIEE